MYLGHSKTSLGRVQRGIKTSFWQSLYLFTVLQITRSSSIYYMVFTGKFWEFLAETREPQSLTLTLWYPLLWNFRWRRWRPSPRPTLICIFSFPKVRANLDKILNVKDSADVIARYGCDRYRSCCFQKIWTHTLTPGRYCFWGGLPHYQDMDTRMFASSSRLLPYMGHPRYAKTRLRVTSRHLLLTGRSAHKGRIRMSQPLLGQTNAASNVAERDTRVLQSRDSLLKFVANIQWCSHRVSKTQYSLLVDWQPLYVWTSLGWTLADKRAT